MVELLTVVWFTAAVVGVVGSVSGMLADGARRRSLLLLGAGGFAVAGVLGILSIGILFLALAFACVAAVSRDEKQSAASS